MAKTLYLMRHGQTLFNELNKIQGWCDSPLTTKGVTQGKVAAGYFTTAGITFDQAYTSTSERASDTLELVTSMPYKRVKDLREWHFGIFEGEAEFLNPALPYDDFFVPYGGEGELAFRQRISAALYRIMQEVDVGHNVLVVSHGAACRQFMLNWEHLSAVTQKERLKNCCVLKFTFADEQFYLEEIINHDFEVERRTRDEQ